MSQEDDIIGSAPRPPDQRKNYTLDLRGVSFGSSAAIVTSMALVVGLDAATATKAQVVGALLIIGIADNLTDIYQEAQRLAERQYEC